MPRVQVDDRYEVLLATAACAVARLDSELRIREFNRQAELTFGLRASDVVGHLFAELAPMARDGEALLRELRHALAGQALSWIECAFVTPDRGERVLLWTAHPIRTEERITGLMLVGQDLTERRQAERQAREHALASERQRRLAEVGAIVARITHDLNNPLCAATLTVALLQEAADRRPGAGIGEFRNELADLDAALTDLKDLADGCRNFLRDQHLELTVLSTADLLRDVLRTWSSEAAQRDILLRTRVAPDLPGVRADAAKLRRVLDNLVRNALEAIGHGPGGVTITVAAADDRSIRIEVQDTGPGLPRGVDVFAAFATTKAHGTGLGLAIARQFVEAHGGTIAAEPVEPHGTRFCVTLPVDPPRAQDLTTDSSLSA
jgi:PAS domain S-box-containing protein